MNMARAITRARPHLVEYEDYTVTDYGDGPVLEWLSREARPTNKELEAAWAEIEAEEKERTAEEEFERQMLSGYSGVTELIAAIVADDSPGRGGGPRQRARERLEELRKKRGRY